MLKNGYIFIFLAIINVGYVEYIDLQMIVKVKFFFFYKIAFCIYSIFL